MLRNDRCITKEGIEKAHYEVLNDLGFYIVNGRKAIRGTYSLEIVREGYVVSYYGDVQYYPDFQRCYDFIMKYANMYPVEFNFLGGLQNEEA